MNANKMRLEGLEREADEVARDLIENFGLMGADLEVIGAILFTKYRGEDTRIDDLLSNTATLLKDADEFLAKLRSDE